MQGSTVEVVTFAEEDDVLDEVGELVPDGTDAADQQGGLLVAVTE
jgi:hypothetical protein